MVKQKVLVLGGGFGGVKTALGLCGDKNFEITLISSHPDFRFYPALYETATGRSAKASAIALQEIFKNKNAKVIIDQVEKLDRGNRTIHGSSGKAYPYDQLVVALGSVTNFFNVQGLAQYAYGVKNLDEAEKLRRHLHEQIVTSANEDIVIVGGGPTGIELAGALPGYISRIRHAHGITSPAPRIDLVEASPRLASRMPARYSRKIEKRLRQLGVAVYLNQAVKAETPGELKLADHSIKSHSVVWTAGVTNNPFLSANGFKLNEHGKATVDPYLRAEDNIFVIGDNADTPFSGMAQTALYDAKHVAVNIKRLAKNKKLRKYRPVEPAYVTPAGEGWAAFKWRNLQTYGRLGWVLRTAADLVAYHDLEPWRQARQHWRAEKQTDVSCPVCSQQ